MNTQQAGGRARPDPRTFRRRRLVVLVILVLLLGGISVGVWALKNRFFPAAPATPEPAAVEPSGPTEEDLANPTDCDAGALMVSIDLAADSLPAAQPTNLPVTIRNTGEVPCLIDASAEAITLSLTSGDDTVWSSDHCGAGLPPGRRLLLDIDAQDTSVVSWPGTRSEPGCPGDQPGAEPGTYRANVRVSVGEATVEEVRVFGLN